MKLPTRVDVLLSDQLSSQHMNGQGLPPIGRHPIPQLLQHPLERSSPVTQTQVDGRLPITTIRTAESIGGILKHLDPGETPVPQYAYSV